METLEMIKQLRKDAEAYRDETDYGSAIFNDKVANRLEELMMLLHSNKYQLATSDTEKIKENEREVYEDKIFSLFNKEYSPEDFIKKLLCDFPDCGGFKVYKIANKETIECVELFPEEDWCAAFLNKYEMKNHYFENPISALKFASEEACKCCNNFYDNYKSRCMSRTVYTYQINQMNRFLRQRLYNEFSKSTVDVLKTIKKVIKNAIMLVDVKSIEYLRHKANHTTQPTDIGIKKGACNIKCSYIIVRECTPSHSYDIIINDIRNNKQIKCANFKVPVNYILTANCQLDIVNYIANDMQSMLNCKNIDYDFKYDNHNIINFDDIYSKVRRIECSTGKINDLYEITICLSEK